MELDPSVIERTDLVAPVAGVGYTEPPWPVDGRVAAFLADTCVFCQPWWLQAVAPDRWDVAVAMRGHEVAAVWPYAYRIRLRRYRLIEIPELTFYLGPWLRSSTAKYARRLAEEKDLIGELVDALPPFAVFQQWLHPSVGNWLPLYWKGFSQTTRYTYRYEATADLDAIWAEVRENIRTDIRKAARQLAVVEETDPIRFLALQRATFARQGLPLPFSADTLQRLDRECAARRARTILVAVDSRGRAHSAVYLVSDRRTMYSLLRASDPDLRASGAGSLVVWECIRRAAAAGKAFDFLGSWVEPIERFVRAFGARQTAFFEIGKATSPVVRGYRALYRCCRGAGLLSRGGGVLGAIQGRDS